MVKSKITNNWSDVRYYQPPLSGLGRNLMGSITLFNHCSFPGLPTYWPGYNWQIQVLKFVICKILAKFKTFKNKNTFTIGICYFCLLYLLRYLHYFIWCKEYWKCEVQHVDFTIFVNIFEKYLLYHISDTR